MNQSVEHWTLEFQRHARLERVCADGQSFVLDFDAPEHAVSVRVEQPFTLRTGDGEFALDPSRPDSITPEMLLLLDEEVSVISIRDGKLHVSFARGVGLEIPPSQDYEAWEIYSEDGHVRLVCMPGGTVASWPGREAGAG